MHGLHSSIALFSFAALTGALMPATAKASPGSSRVVHVARHAPDKLCAKAPVKVTAGAESATFSLAKCDGGALAAGVDQLSILARGGTVPRPTEPAILEKSDRPDLAPGMRRLDPRLIERLQLAVDHFRSDADGEADPAHLVVVSGIRPRNAGSYHSAGRAIDFRIEGIKNDALVAFCKTLPDTGCGYYPNDVFIHMDVREPGTGHVAWVANRTGDVARHAANDPTGNKNHQASAPDTAVGDATGHEGRPRDVPDAVATRDGVEQAPTLSLSRPAAPMVDGDRRGQREDGTAAESLARLPALPESAQAEPRRTKHRHHKVKGGDARHSI